MKRDKLILLISLIFLGSCFVIVAGCKKSDSTSTQDPPYAPAIPVLTTAAVTNLNSLGGTCGGDVVSQGSSSVTGKGICWSASINPTILDSHSVDGAGMGPFTSHITGITPRILYFVRAYATNSVGTGYGNQLTFMCLPDTLLRITAISQLKAMYHPDSSNLMQIPTNTYIEGVVAGNDQSGNIYKNLYIQDLTGGICISVDMTSLFQTYVIGQKLMINCTGLYLGSYGGTLMLGLPYNGTIGRISSTMFSQAVTQVGLPGAPPPPAVVNMGHLPELNSLVSMLVAINSVTLPDSGLVFADPSSALTFRRMADSAGNINPSLVIYTSKYANFSANLIPGGIGTLQGILMVYNGKYEMILRDTNDLIGFRNRK